MMHSIIDDICTGCELCIEPCPVDCIEIVESSQRELSKTRDLSQTFFDLKETLTSGTERVKIKNLSDQNLSISKTINLQLKNRDIDKFNNLKKMQINIAKSDLERLHNLQEDKIDDFIDKDS
mgnify:CR=1 FL=1